MAYQTRLPKPEADAFAAYVIRRSRAATGSPDALSAASVIRGLMLAAVEAEAVPTKAKPTKGKAGALEATGQAQGPGDRWMEREE